MHRRRLLLWSIIIALSIWVVSQKPLAQFTRVAIYSDFMGYWSATRLFLTGSSPYDPAALSAIFNQYGRSISQDLVTWAPPWIFLLLWPFAALDITVARLLWFVANCFAVIAFTDYMWDLVGRPERCRWQLWLSGIVFIPSALALNLGQTSPIVLAGFHAFLFALRRKQYFLAGAATYLLSVKPHIVLLFFYFLLLWIIRHRKYMVLTGAATGVGLACLFGYVTSPQIYAHYLKAIAAGRGPLIWETPTLGTMLRLLFQTPNIPVHMIPTLAGLLLSTALWVRWRNHFTWESHGADVLLLSAITSFYAWTFDWVVLLPAIVPALASAFQNPRQNWSWGCWCLAIQLLLLIQLVGQRNYVGTLWFPTATGLLYWVHDRYRSASAAQWRNQPP